MEPRGGVDPPDLRGLNLEVLRRAVDLYLAKAYPTGAIPEIVRRRLNWPPDIDVATLLNGSLFERSAPASGEGPPIFALRLGNVCYPHMKLQIQTWPGPAGYMISVNTHDQVLGLDPNAVDAAAFRTLQAENQRIKEAIEAAWDETGLPTFLRYLRDYIGPQADSVP